jgi:two-component system, chemotaxis family, CheB/CheR fusion protein
VKESPLIFGSIGSGKRPFDFQGKANEGSPGSLPEREAQALQRLRDLVREKRGVDLSFYGESYLGRKLAVQQKSKSCPTLDDFIELLSADAREIDLFLGTLIVRVTEFFRSPRTFEVLEQRVLPALLAQKRKDLSHVVRCWSAGCSSGEEAYSLAILLREVLKREKDRFSALIFATDIDQQGLLAARRGLFDRAKLAKVKQEWRDSYFKKEGEGFVIGDEVRRMIIFRVHNLQDPPPFHNLDLILFRNVLIYLKPELQTRLLASFFEFLNPGGYLVLGRTEGGVGTMPPEYGVADPAERIYQRPLEGSA